MELTIKRSIIIITNLLDVLQCNSIQLVNDETLRVRKTFSKLWNKLRLQYYA